MVKSYCAHFIYNVLNTNIKLKWQAGGKWNTKARNHIILNELLISEPHLLVWKCEYDSL